MAREKFPAAMGEGQGSWEDSLNFFVRFSAAARSALFHEDARHQAAREAGSKDFSEDHPPRSLPVGHAPCRDTRMDTERMTAYGILSLCDDDALGMIPLL